MAPLAGFVTWVTTVGVAVGEPLAYVHLEMKWWREPFAIPYTRMLTQAWEWFRNFIARGEFGPPEELLAFFPPLPCWHCSFGVGGDSM